MGIEWIRSIEVPLALWVMGVALLIPAAIRTVRAINRLALIRLHRDESGAAYSLIYLLCFPAYAWVLCLVIQCTLIFMVKCGTMYAAYATARSAIVWRTAQPEDYREKRIKQASIMAMTPFSSYLAIPNQFAYPSPETVELYTGYKLYVGNVYDGPKEEYFRRCWRYAERATTIEYVNADDTSNEQILVRIKYQMPMHIPGIGLILGKPSIWPDVEYRVYEVSSTMDLPSEAARSENKLVGIDYHSNNNF